MNQLDPESPSRSEGEPALSQPEPAPVPAPGNLHMILAILATLCFLLHGLGDVVEWTIIMDDSGVEMTEETEESPNMEEAGSTEIGDAVKQEEKQEEYESAEQEVYESALPPVWMGALMAVIFPMGLLLAFAAEWSIQKTLWKVGVIVFCLIESVFGAGYFLFFYEVAGLEATGLLFGLFYLGWNANRILLLLMWNTTRKLGWLLPGLALGLFFSIAALLDVVTYIFVEPSAYGFGFLEGTFVQNNSMKLSEMGDLGMYAWLGAKFFVTLSVLLLVTPVIFKQRPVRSS